MTDLPDSAVNDAAFVPTSKSKTRVDPVALATNPVHRYGIKISRSGRRDKVRFGMNNFKALWKLLSNLDPNMVFINHKNDTASAHTFGTFKRVKASPLKTFVDHQSMLTNRSAPEPGECAMFSLYLASNVLSFQSLANDPTVQCWLHENGCRLASHSLLESVGDTVCYLLYKNPRYSYRKGLAKRLEDHISTHYGATHVPVQVRVKEVVVDDCRATLCQVVVGSAHRQLAQGILAKHKHPTLEWITPAELYRPRTREHSKRHLQLHNVVTATTKAYTIAHMTPALLEDLRSKLSAETSLHAAVIDVDTRPNFEHNGIAYLQHQSKASEAVRAFLDQWIGTVTPQDPNPDPQSPPGPEVVVRSDSVQETIRDGDTTRGGASLASPTVLKSRFDTEANQKLVKTTKDSSSVAASFRTPRSLPSNIVTKSRWSEGPPTFSSPEESESSRASSITDDHTDKTDPTNNTKKSKREAQLERELHETKLRQEAMEKELRELRQAIANLTAQSDTPNLFTQPPSPDALEQAASPAVSDGRPSTAK